MALAKLSKNPGHQMMLVDFWATWCGSCIVEFADLQDTLRMYGARDYSVVTVSANMPDEKAGVLRFLQKKHATSKNYLFDSQDTTALQTAFDPKVGFCRALYHSAVSRWQGALQAARLCRSA